MYFIGILTKKIFIKYQGSRKFIREMNVLWRTRPDKKLSVNQIEEILGPTPIWEKMVHLK